MRPRAALGTFRYTLRRQTTLARRSLHSPQPRLGSPSSACLLPMFVFSFACISEILKFVFLSRVLTAAALPCPLKVAKFTSSTSKLVPCRLHSHRMPCLCAPSPGLLIRMYVTLYLISHAQILNPVFVSPLTSFRMDVILVAAERIRR
jgi:hypothetical protein